MNDYGLDTQFSNLTILEVYFYYDFPRDFAAATTCGQLFIAFWNGPREGEGQNWLFLPVSIARLEEVRRGDWGLREAVLASETGLVYQMQTRYPNDPIIGVDPQTIPENNLPLADYRLNETDPLPELAHLPNGVRPIESAE